MLDCVYFKIGTVLTVISFCTISPDITYSQHYCLGSPFEENLLYLTSARCIIVELKLFVVSVTVCDK